ARRARPERRRDAGRADLAPARRSVAGSARQGAARADRARLSRCRALRAARPRRPGMVGAHASGDLCRADRLCESAAGARRAARRSAVVGPLPCRRGALRAGREGSVDAQGSRRGDRRPCRARRRAAARREGARRMSGDLIAQLQAGVLGVLSLLSPLGTVTAWLVICQGALQSLVYLAQLVLAYRALRHGPPVRGGRALWWDYSEVAMPIALLVPAYNEEATIGESIRSMLSLQYPNFEVIVINDGSTDGTMEALIAAFDLTPMVRPYDESVAHRPIQSMYGSQRYSNLL